MSTPMLTIKAYSATDKADWLPLWKAYQAFYKTTIADHVTDTSWQRMLDDNEPVSGALAWLDGKAVGMVHHIRHRSTWATGDYCYLQDLYVEPEIRGHGIGRKLIEYVYQLAEQQGCSRVYWLTHESNKDAMILYDKVADKPGFVQYRKMLG